VAANPLLVVASAANPRVASTFADPSSHALGISNGSPGTCRARNRAVMSVPVKSLLVILATPGTVPSRAGSDRGDQASRRRPVSGTPSSRARTRSSRARATRDRIVPTGQPHTCAASA
jgi:hypothetical protein